MKKKLTAEIALTLAIVTAAAAAVSSVRSTLFSRHQQAKNEHDVYFLPPADQLGSMSLGYRHALADVLWAYVLVSQGLHSFEQRRFENLTRIYEAINTLAPTWRSPYLLADALITFQANVTPYEDVLKAREILELGTKHRPYDAEIWLNLGQFVSFVAPWSYLDDTHPKVALRWRTEGTEYLARAAELGAGGDGLVAWQALGGASILRKAGQRDAAIRFLERTYAVTDDAELKQELLTQLARLTDEKHVEQHRKRSDAFKDAWKDDLPFVSRDLVLLLGPPPELAACAGGGDHSQRCATDWRTWYDRHQKSADVSP